MKKFLAVLLTMSMVLSLVTVPVLAEQIVAETVDRETFSDYTKDTMFCGIDSELDGAENQYNYGNWTFKQAAKSNRGWLLRQSLTDDNDKKITVTGLGASNWTNIAFFYNNILEGKYTVTGDILNKFKDSSTRPYTLYFSAEEMDRDTEAYKVQIVKSANDKLKIKVSKKGQNSEIVLAEEEHDFYMGGAAEMAAQFEIGFSPQADGSANIDFKLTNLRSDATKDVNDAVTLDTITDAEPLSAGYFGVVHGNNAGNTTKETNTGNFKFEYDYYYKNAVEFNLDTLSVEAGTEYTATFSKDIANVDIEDAIKLYDNDIEVENAISNIYKSGNNQIKFTFSDANIGFNKPYELKIENLYDGNKIALKANTNIIFVRSLYGIGNIEIKRTNDSTYISTYDIKNYVGDTVSIKTNIANKTDESQDYSVVFAIIDQSGKLVWNKVKNIENAGADEEIEETNVAVPSGLEAGSKLVAFLWNGFGSESAAMQTLYPNNEITAEGTATDVAASIGGDGTVTISGIAPNEAADKRVTLLVFNPNKDIADIETDGAAEYIAEGISNSEGRFSFSFPLNDLDGVGTHKYYVSGQNFSTPASKTFLYVTDADRNNAIGDINDAIDDVITEIENDGSNVEALKGALTELILNNDEILGYNVGLYAELGGEPENTKLAMEIAEMMIAGDINGVDVKNYIQDGTGDDFNKKLTLILSFLAYNYSKAEVVYKDNKLALISDAKDIDGYLSLYDKLTTTGQDTVKASLLGKGYTEYDRLEEDFKKSVILNAIRQNKDAENDYSYVTDIIKTYTTADLEIYNTLPEMGQLEVNERLAKDSSYTTIAEMETRFAEIVADYEYEHRLDDNTKYSYTFTEADLTESAWTIGEAYTWGTVDDHTGLYLSAGGTEEPYEIVSPMSLDGDYELTVSVYQRMNSSYLIFNKSDANNYYKLLNAKEQETDGSGGTKDVRYATLTSVEDGNERQIAKVKMPAGTDYSAYTFTLKYDSLGIISINMTKNGTEYPIIIDAKDTTHRSGKFAIALNSTVGIVKSFKYDLFLSATGGHVATGERVGLTEAAEVGFNFPIDPDCVEGNFEIKDEQGNIITDYTYEIADVNRTLKIHPKTKWKEDSTYTFVLKPSLYMYMSDKGAPSEKEYTFRTESLGVYAEAPVSDGTDVTINIGNNSDTPQNITAILTVTDASGNQTAYEEAVSVGGNTTTPATVTFTRVGDVSGKTMDYVLLNDNMQTVYPVVKNQGTATLTGTSQSKNTGANIEQRVENDERVLYISGTTESKLKDRNINIVVKDNGGAVVYANRVTTGVNGTFESQIPVTKADTDYTISVGGDDYATKLSDTHKFAIDTTAQAAAEAIISSTTAANIEAKKEDLGINQTLYNDLRIDKDKLATRVSNRISALSATRARTIHPLAADGGAGLQSLINEQMLFMAYESNAKDLIFNHDGSFKTDIVDMADVDSALTAKVWTPYTKLNATGKTNVDNSLFGKNYTNKDQLYTQFVAGVVINGIQNYSINGYGHINSLIKDNDVVNLSGTDTTLLTIPKYNGLTNTGSVDEDLLSADLSTVDTLAELASTIEELIPEGGSGEGLGGGAGSGSGAGGGSGDGGGSSEIVEGGGGPTVDNSTIQKTVFNDIAGVEWAKEAIEKLYYKAVLSGDGNGNFRPNDSVLREEFVKIAVEAFDMGLGGGNAGFTDCSKDDWCYQYLNTAKAKKIITGRADGSFGMGENITREDVAVILYRILVANKQTGEFTSVIDSFTDKDSISDYAYEAIDYLTGIGVISGKGNGILQPRATCTRAEAAKMVYEIIK